MMLTIIAAAAENNALGKDNQLLWHLPDDFKRFKQITTGHYIIMGRKTFESFPKPLPDRTHVVITRQAAYALPPNCLTAASLKDAISKVPGGQDSFIIGGGQIYAQAMDIADAIDLTRVHGTFEADTYFPEIDHLAWELVFTEHHAADERHKFAFTFETYHRKPTI